MFTDINNEAEFIKKLNSMRNNNIESLNPNNILKSKFGLNKFNSNNNLIPMSSNFKFSETQDKSLYGNNYNSNSNSNNKNDMLNYNKYLNNNSNSANYNVNFNAFNQNNSNRSNMNFSNSRIIPHEKYAANTAFTNNLSNINSIEKEKYNANINKESLTPYTVDNLKTIEEKIEKMGNQISMLQNKFNSSELRYENQNKQIIELQENLKNGFNKLDVVLEKLQLNLNNQNK
jgi:hypothetical protein